MKGGKAFAVGPVTPLVVRGPAPVLSWSPQRIQPASADTVQRLLDLYRHTDVKLASVIDDEHQARRHRAVRRYGAKARRPAPRAGARAISPKPPARPRNFSRSPTVRASARSRSTAGIRTTMKASRKGGCRNCSARSTTHSARSRPTWDRRGARPLSFSSPSSAAPRASTALTAPITAPRRSRFLAGGALKGGRVIADWPGLKTANLYENRDLKPTTDLRAVLKGAVEGSPARRRSRAGGECFSRQRGREADGGVGWDSRAARPREGGNPEPGFPPSRE